MPGREGVQTVENAPRQLEVREYVDDDEAECLALRNEVFPPISVEDWRAGGTAAVALLGGQVVGVVPFVLRTFRLRADLAVKAAFANSVAVVEELRGSGIGAAMMTAAAGFLPARADAMFVYTGDEAEGRPYRFYRRTGHADLAYPATYRLVNGATSAARCSVRAEPVDRAGIGALEGELLDAFYLAWGWHGGHCLHETGYYQRALSSHIFVELPVEEFLLARAEVGGRLLGYALVAVRATGISVLELACHAGEVVGALTAWMGRLGLHRGVPVTTWSCRPPYEGLEVHNWTRQRRQDVVVGRCIRPDAVWQAAAGPLAGSLRVEVWTPEGGVNFGPEGAPTLRLEMKREQLEQLLLCRRNLESDVRHQQVTVASGTWRQVMQASTALRAGQWECHELDYI